MILLFNIFFQSFVWFGGQAGSGVGLSKKEIISNFLQGTVASHLETFGDDDETDAVKPSPSVGMLFIYFD